MTMMASISTILEELRAVIDEREQLSMRDSELSKRKDELEKQLLDYHGESGLQSVKGGGLTISFDDSAVRAKYDPDKWNNIIRWAVETGNEHVIQRRLTDKKCESLLKEGVAFPDGLTLENYTKISTRRT